MKRKFILLAFVFFILTTASAQIVDGNPAKNFSMKDLDGNTHKLFDYLDDGKVVVIDFFAVWCQPCWSYHNSGAFKTAWNNWGPQGGSDQLMLFAIECDEGTIAQINGAPGTESSSWGDFVTGTPYPIIATIPPNSASIGYYYNVQYLPTVQLVCPDKKGYGFSSAPSANTIKSRVKSLCGIELNAPSSIEDEYSLKNLVSIYPNPIIDFFNIEIVAPETGNLIVTILDLTGKVISSENLGTIEKGLHNLPMNNDLSSGLYFIKLDINKYSTTQKLIIQ